MTDPWERVARPPKGHNPRVGNLCSSSPSKVLGLKVSLWARLDLTSALIRPSSPVLPAVGASTVVADPAWRAVRDPNEGAVIG